MQKNLQQKKEYKEVDQNLFFKVSIKVIKEGYLLPSLSGSELKALLAIASFINNQSQAYPSQIYISSITGLSVSTISKSVQRLSKKGLLEIRKEFAEGNKFTNNRYVLSNKSGISFGNYSNVRETVSQEVQTKKNNTNNNNQILNNNQVVSSFKKKIEMEDEFSFYSKLISKDKYFDGDIEHAERTLRKNIKDMGDENWKDLMKILQNHPDPRGLLNHIRYFVSQEGLTYQQAWDEWNKKF